MQPVKNSESVGNQHSPQRAVPLPRQAALILACISVAAIVSILAGTARWGIGISPDSTLYVGAARSLISSGALLAVEADGHIGPLTHYPPLMPLILAGPSMLFHADPVSSARWVSAVSFGLSVGLLGVVAWRILKSARLAILASLLGWTATPLLDINLLALSEPPYLVLVLLSFLCMIHYAERRTMRWLLLAACSTALVFLCRYAGASLVAAEILVIFILERRNLLAALKNVSIFALVSCLPIAGWFLRNYLVSDSLTTRQVGTHWISPSMLMLGISNLSTWLLPGAVPFFLRAGIVLLLTLILGAAYFYLRSTTAPAAQHRFDPDFQVVTLFPLFVVCHVAMLLVVASFLDGDTHPDDRNLLPIYGPGILILLWIFKQMGSWKIGGVPARLLPVLTVILLFATNGPRSASHLISSARNGRDYTSRQWQTSPVINKLRSLPEGEVIYTTLPSAVRFLTGHPTRLLPNSFSSKNQLVNGDYERKVLEMRRDAEQRRIAVAYFGRRPGSSFLPESEARVSFRLTLVAEDGLGAAYESEPPSKTTLGRLTSSTDVR